MRTKRSRIARALMWRRFVWLGALVLAAEFAFAQTPKPPADRWLDEPFQHPPQAGAPAGTRAAFESIETDAVAGKLKIYWAAGASSVTAATLFASADTPGHWPARDWRQYPMSLRGGRWEASVPVESVDIPMIFFIRANPGGAMQLSPMRICAPRAAGLEQPSQLFWPYLEGFEGTLEGWRWADDPTASRPLQLDPLAKQGKFSLLVNVPGRVARVAVTTTRVRGWQIAERSATGLRLWMRTRSGPGRARFTLHALSGSPQQFPMHYAKEIPIDARWQKVDLAFDLFGPGPRAEIDLFTIEFSAEAQREFLLDELQLLGPWRLDIE